MIIETVILMTIFKSLDGRVVELCGDIFLENVDIVSNADNVICLNATDQTFYQLNILSNSKVSFNDGVMQSAIYFLSGLSSTISIPKPRKSSVVPTVKICRLDLPTSHLH